MNTAKIITNRAAKCTRNKYSINKCQKIHEKLLRSTDKCQAISTTDQPGDALPLSSQWLKVLFKIKIYSWLPKIHSSRKCTWQLADSAES